MKPELAQKMGISAETPIVIGASDGVLANGSWCDITGMLQLRLERVVRFEQSHQI